MPCELAGPAVFPKIAQIGSWWYISSMKEKTSITLSQEVLNRVDRLAGSKQSRSAFIEAVLVRYLREHARAQRDARDLVLINRHAEQLNRDALDALEYQAPLGELPEELG